MKEKRNKRGDRPTDTWSKKTLTLKYFTCGKNFMV
jgi:hypothetical protein